MAVSSDASKVVAVVDAGFPYVYTWPDSHRDWAWPELGEQGNLAESEAVLSGCLETRSRIFQTRSQA